MSHSFLSSRWSGVLLAALLLAGATTADAQRRSAQPSPFSSVEALGLPAAPGFGGANLILDDGSAENSIGLTAGGSFIWFNRFTPPAGDFPLRIVSAEVYFDAPASGNGYPVGSVYDVYVYSDPDGNPANGATWVQSATGQVVTAQGSFLTTTFASPALINTPGDVLILVVNRTNTGPNIFPAALDQSSAPQGRSWVGFGTTPPADPPVLPAATMGTIDSFGIPGNWLVRGTYQSVISGPNLVVTPTSVAFGTVGAGTSPAPVTVTLRNNGDAPLTISGITFAGSSAVTLNTTGTSLTLAPGATTTFTVNASAASVGSLDGTITVTHNGPTSPTTIAVTGQVGNIAMRSYCSGTPITIPTGGPFVPYPATVSVPALGAGESVERVMIRMVGLSHDYVEDVNMFVRHPLGPTVTLMEQAGGDSAPSNVNLTFDDGAPPIPESGPVVSGTYAPTSYDTVTYPAPAPAPSGGLLLSAFAGADPAGAWQLWGFDSFPLDGGSITDWCVDLTVDLGTPSGPETFSSTDTPLPITDNVAAGITSTIVVPASETRGIADLDLDLRVTHTWVGDLAATLARGAQTAQLFNRPGTSATSTFGCSGDNMNFFIDDEGTDGAIQTTCLGTGTAQAYLVDGRYTPNQPLSVFDGTPMAGSYVLTISDNAAGDTGTLNSWALIITPGVIIGTEGGAPASASRLSVAPNPVATQGQVTLVSAESQDVRVALYDALGREVAVLLERSLTAGQEAHIAFRTAGLAPGVYVVRAQGSEGLVLTQRLTVVR